MDVANLSRVEGPNLVLRLIEPGDAAYVHALRTDPAYNRHLSPVAGDVEDQRRWIEPYKAREARVEELYYVIERRDGNRCGLVRLYDIGRDTFTWGSWILDENKPRKAALESAILSFEVGFNYLNLPTALVDVHSDNSRALSIYLRLGMVEVKRTKDEIFLTYSRVRFRADHDALLSILTGTME